MPADCFVVTTSGGDKLCSNVNLGMASAVALNALRRGYPAFINDGEVCLELRATSTPEAHDGYTLVIPDGHAQPRWRDRLFRHLDSLTEGKAHR